MLRLQIKLGIALLACLGSAAAQASSTGTNIEAVGVPSGFSELTRARETVADVYFGGRKVGEARVTARPGFVRIHDPEQVISLLPNVIMSPAFAAAMTDELPANANRICPLGTTRDCGSLSPDLVGVIFDEDRFRLDVFVNPMWLQLMGQEEEYLPTPTAPLSLTSSMGVALSGSDTASPLYNFQNRTLVSFRNARVRSESSYASKFGLLVDSFVAEVDQPDLRYSAGLFWAPGLDLTGQRRILGVGVGTQFDTRADRDQLRGTPLILFLAQPARVEIVVDGRLLGSGLYEAGNNVIDTSGMPDGSYSVVLRIHERAGGVREERRFFTKNAQIAPLGQPIYFAYAGMLANSRPGRPISVSKDIFYQVGTARRLSRSVAVDASLIGTAKKPLLEVGTWLITEFARIRAAGLVSARGDRAALLQIASARSGRLTLSFDLRRIWSRDNTPLLPISTYVDTFDSTPLTSAQLGNGSYTQASGSVGYRIGNAYLAVIGSLRKDKGLAADYSIGPNLSWPIVNRNGLQIALQADAQLTRTTTAGYLGVRMLFTSGRYSAFSTLGRRGTASRDSSSRSNWSAVASTQAQYSYQHDEQTELSLAAGVDRDVNSTLARAGGILRSRFGTARGEILHDFEGDKRTQYALTVQSGAALTRNHAVVGGRSLEESALVVSVSGTAADSEFDVLVDEQPRGRLRTGGRLPIFLQPYHSYNVRLRPVNAASVWFESSPREITLYPGNVQHVRWHAEQLITVFGRAVRPDGRPVADAVVTSRRGVGQSNAEGYFQIEVTANESLSFASNGGDSCNVSIAAPATTDDYAAIGKVVCR